MSTPPRPIPRATYRLQLNSDFGFRDAAGIVPYLADLGISHVYLSPFLRARPGSTHGYDIVSHAELNPDLGSEADYRALVARLREAGLRQLVDIVPNHMGVGGSDNPLWLDILEWGPDSAYAAWFDIDWAGDRRSGRGRLLVPLLGDQYGAVLAAGELRLKFDATAGAFAVWAYDTHKLPISPLHYERILGSDNPALERLGDAFAHLVPSRTGAAGQAHALQSELAAAVAGEPRVAAALERRLARFEGRPGDIASWQKLAALIADQHWRAAHFRVAADDINYRRFFNVNELAGLRMELPEVFEHAHALLFGLIEEGSVDGLRVDHVDGLLDPKGYCLRLREKAPKPVYLVVEKILAPHERLREDWDVDGTTGYEFANLVTGLLIDPAGERPLDDCYADFTGCRTPFADIVRTSKLQIMEDEMAGELKVLAREAGAVARSNPLTADFTEKLIERAMKAVIAAFPVYRTYVGADGRPTGEDRRDIDWAFALARRNTALDPSVFDFLHGLLTCDLVARPGSGFSRSEVVRVAMRAQQYSGPVMAKGLEDTAFYRYNRMLALNEVGGQPTNFGVSIAAFHQANRQRAARTPHALLSTSTHDTKRGEDARARLAVIAELPEEWTHHVTLWSRMLRGPEGAGTASPLPSANDEYAFYQLLLGAWDTDLSPGEPDGLERLQARLEGAMLKSVREAKLHTTWALPDPAYEDAVRQFVAHALDTSRANAFVESFAGFAARIAPLGVRNSLVQTVLKLTVPGVPDIYQGAEFLDLSLVDPDNRRPVDFAARRATLAEVAEKPLEDTLDGGNAGAIKQRIVRDLLLHRRSRPGLFADGDYRPLRATGPAADRVCAFERRLGDEAIIVAVARFPTRGSDGLAETTLPLRPSDGQRWVDLFTGREVRRRNRAVNAAELFARLPVAVLVNDPPPSPGDAEPAATP
ncbi:MAG: malto-oligosyltrehalose synthase [Rhizobiales bacterium]|nr:malto-oligosyltrehalose synthase [Hyphomicrobiales bacterium]